MTAAPIESVPNVGTVAFCTGVKVIFTRAHKEVFGDDGKNKFELTGESLEALVGRAPFSLRGFIRYGHKGKGLWFGLKPLPHLATPPLG